jgi:hypothetical protein
LERSANLECPESPLAAPNLRSPPDAIDRCHSKKSQNHEAALALFFAYYNVCRVHLTLKTTPAVASSLTSCVWNLERLLHEAE